METKSSWNTVSSPPCRESVMTRHGKIGPMHFELVRGLAMTPLCATSTNSRVRKCYGGDRFNHFGAKFQFLY